MKRAIVSLSLLAGLTLPSAALAQGKNFTVHPGQFDPGKTYLVQAAWLQGIGCPTGATVANANATGTDIASFSPFTDPACATGDAQDKRHEGLLLVKTGPTGNFAAAGATLNGVKNQVLTELGFDIRKPDSQGDVRGSHCGAGAPRFNVGTSAGFFFVGCQQLQQTAASNGWVRLRAVPGPGGDIAGIPPGAVIDFISIVFDEGQDAGPDNFGAAILDNIDVNGVLVGRGPTNAK